MKILVEPISLKNIKELNKTNIDGYIIGLKNFAVFQSLKLSALEIRNLDLNGKELFISINKPIHNETILSLKEELKEIAKLKPKGVLFEDLAIYQINKELSLNLNLIWNQMHLVTNSETINYYQEKGVKGAFLSTELMIEDFVKIKKETNMLIFVYLYGHLPISESSRSLITNYLTYLKKDKDKDLYYLYEEKSNKYYPIYEEDGNTFILGDIVDGINEVAYLKENKIDYLVLNGLLCDDHDFIKVVNDYLNVLNGKVIKKEVYDGFFHQESIFKVTK